jgi:hypothetical protein
VERWRKEVWQPAAARFAAPICYVWHVADSIDEWYRLLDRDDVRCLGVGGKVAMRKGGDGFYAGDLARMVEDAYRAGKPVHGFAKVHRELMMAVPFASVDSTSWASGVLYGSHTRFDAQLGKLQREDVGRRAQKTDTRKVLGTLAVHARGRLRAEDLRASGADTTAATIGAFYQETADAYEAWEDWLTAWWRARGIDWTTRLGAGSQAPASRP